MILSRDFYQQPTLTVARQLLGQHLCRRLPSGETLVGRIVETEAYIGFTDSACHASKGQTARNKVMFGAAGHAYLYLIYGLYSMFNIVTEPEGSPCAVLIRALEPVEGIDTMQQLRGQRLRQLTNGPGRLAQALALDRSLNGVDLTCGDPIWVEAAPTVIEDEVVTGPRIGICYADPVAVAAPWRFWVKTNPFVSKLPSNLKECS